jgi:hypothetical protein
MWSYVKRSQTISVCQIEVNEKDEVSGWMIANVWTDDVRYFGTDDVIRKYEKDLQNNVKVKFLGVPGEFVGTDFITI